MDIFIGFDSAWTDNAKAPGAICAVGIEDGIEKVFRKPELATFEDALDFIREVRSADGVTLIALDQPTVVPNLTGIRPVERAAASIVSWLGGGVQPSNRSRKRMFCDESPIWPFLKLLGAEEKPDKARAARSGLFLMEVFPALALASLNDDFCMRLGGPKYNPGRKKTFKQADWTRVAETAAAKAEALHCPKLAAWCREAAHNEVPKKRDQDLLDSALCTLIALHWRLRPREESVLLGDPVTGYMVLPASPEVGRRLKDAGERYSVPLDDEAAWIN